MKTQYHCEITTVGPARFIRVLLVKLSTVIILTHDNQSTLSSFSLFLSLWQIVPWLMKPTLVPLWAWLSLRHGTAIQGYLISSL